MAISPGSVYKRSVKLLLVLASAAIFSFESRRGTWPYFPYEKCYMFWNWVWILPVNLPQMGVIRKGT
jgi:hypothetical protein